MPQPLKLAPFGTGPVLLASALKLVPFGTVPVLLASALKLVPFGTVPVLLASALKLVPFISDPIYSSFLRSGAPEPRMKLAMSALIIGSDFLMDGGVTAAYWFGELAPK